MSEPLPPWLANLDPRFVRPDWKKWVRPDWQRWLPPDPGPSLRERLWRPYREEPGATIEAQPEFRSELARLDRTYRHGPANPSGTRATGSATPRTDLALLRFKIALHKLRLKALHPSHFDPNQPRVPAGNPDGGEWTTEEREAERIRFAGLLDSIRDVDGTPYYKPKGHHEIPQALYNKWNLPPETRKVFEQATTGKIPQMTIRTTPDGVPVGHFWNGPRGAHGLYKEGIEELSNRYFEKNNIKTDKMTPSQALDLLKEVRETQDPRIRDYNRSMRMLRRLFPLRRGRGTE